MFCYSGFSSFFIFFIGYLEQCQKKKSFPISPVKKNNIPFYSIEQRFWYQTGSPESISHRIFHLFLRLSIQLLVYLEKQGYKELRRLCIALWKILISYKLVDIILTVKLLKQVERLVTRKMQRDYGKLVKN